MTELMKKVTNQRKNTSIIIAAVLLVIGLLCGAVTGCSQANNDSGNGDAANDTASGAADEKLIYENAVSPNKNFVENEEDIVTYTIQIYQKDGSVKVAACSDSGSAEDLSYEVEWDGEIVWEDIAVDWQTIMGDTNFTEENQVAVAVVTLSSGGEVVSQRKVNFVSNAIDIIVDGINKEQ